MNIYTKEMLEKMGRVYKELLHILNKKGHDPYSGTVDIKPFYCLVMILPRAVAMGIPEDLNKEIGELMNLISPGQVEALMTTPVPIEMRQYFLFGYDGFR